MAYEVVMSYHLHMPSYFLGTFTEYPKLVFERERLVFLGYTKKIPGSTRSTGKDSCRSCPVFYLLAGTGRLPDITVSGIPWAKSRCDA